MSKKEKTILYAVCAVVVCAIIAVCVVSNMGSGEKREKEMKASGKQLVSAVVGECELYALRRWNGYDSRFLRSRKMVTCK